MRVYEFHSWLKLQPCFLISRELEKAVIIWLHREGGGLERHAPLYLKFHAIYWSILEYLLSQQTTLCTIKGIPIYLFNGIHFQISSSILNQMSFQISINLFIFYPVRHRNQPMHRNPVCYPRQNNVIYQYFEYF